MAVIYVYNNNNGTIEKYTRGRNDPMPYNIGKTLTVGEFLGQNDMGWTDISTMNAWNAFREFYQNPISVSYAFKRVGQIAFDQDYQHLAGAAFAILPDNPSQKDDLHYAAEESGIWNFVLPFSFAANEVVVDMRYLPSESFVTSGFPNLYNSTRSNYVFLAQDALNTYGFNAGTVDGIYGKNTENAVRAFQAKRYLSEDGFVTRMEWDSILAMATS